MGADLIQDSMFANANSFFAGAASVGITQASRHTPYQVFFIGAVANDGAPPKRSLTTALVTTGADAVGPAQIIKVA